MECGMCFEMITKWHVCVCSYKEDSDDVTDSDDIIEAATPTEAEVENKETIEKILGHRFGKKGGVYFLL